MSDAGGRLAYTAGLDVVWLKGASPVTIDSVKLGGPDADVLKGVNVIDKRKSDMFASPGLLDGYPPRMGGRGMATTRAAWARRVPAAGARLESGSGHMYYLVAGLVTTAAQAKTPIVAGPLVIEYTDDNGNHGMWTSNIDYQLKPNCNPNA